MLRINQIKIPITEYQTSEEIPYLLQKAARVLRLPDSSIHELTIVKRSLDARKKDQIHYLYSVDVKLSGVDEAKLVKRLRDANVSIAPVVIYQAPQLKPNSSIHKVSVIGMGPAGLFCALMLARAGMDVEVFERGGDVTERTKKVNHFFDGQELDCECNVQYGEGGAGTFSDGKLNTGIKDKSGRIHKVLQTFVEHGANPSILYENKPHIGTDVLASVVMNIRKEILALGGKVHFHAKLTNIFEENKVVKGIEINHSEHYDTDAVVLAIGHSARDTFYLLMDHMIPMEEKAFAVGLRLEHPQQLIDENTYHLKNRGALSAADYKVTAKAQNGRGVFSFCMCPGGYVVNASSENGMTCTNGMSYSLRDGVNANSAIIVTVTPEDYQGGGPLAGIEFQRRLERAAYNVCNGKIPYQLNEDFQKGVASTGYAGVVPQIKGGMKPADLREILPEFVSESIIDGMKSFDKMIRGFDRPDAVFSGVESRTSSPVRILRKDNLESIGMAGLYPCGEGAGYAGGITSAAVDGIKVAEAILNHE